MSHGYQNRRICAVQAFCAAKSWRRWNSLPPSILITLGLSRLRRVKQKNAPSGARQVKCPADSKTGAFAPYKHFAPAKSWRRANSLRPSILNYPWVEPPAAAKPKKKRQPTVVSSFLVEQGCSRMNTPPKLRFRFQMPLLYHPAGYCQCSTASCWR